MNSLVGAQWRRRTHGCSRSAKSLTATSAADLTSMQPTHWVRPAGALQGAPRPYLLLVESLLATCWLRCMYGYYKYFSVDGYG